MNNKFTKFLFGILLLSLPLLVSAQDNGNVEGQITGADSNEPLVGVNVVVMGTTIGTSTDIEGRYSLNVPDPENDVIIATYLGYETYRAEVNNRTEINIIMNPRIMLGDELIVVGYGTQRRENLTGSISTIRSDNFSTIPAANTSQLIQGKLPGVTVSNFAPQPGRDHPQIRIRGIGTMNTGQNPLVVIDGVTSSLQELGRMSPSDITDITILKDAASAAIYGARAANGVILVRTDQGGVRPTEFTFRSTFTRQEPLIKLDLLESPEYARTVNEWLEAGGSPPVYSEEQIQMMESGSNPDLFANTDWHDEVIRPALMQQYHLSATGGTETAQYMVSTAYKNQPGIMIGTEAEQISLRTNLNINLSDRARIGVNISGYYQNVEEPAMGSASGGGDNSIMYQIRRFAKPTVPVRYSNGYYGSVDGAYPDWGIAVMNPVENALLGEDYENQYFLNAKVGGQVTLFDNLELKSEASGIYNSSKRSVFQPTNQTFDMNGDIINQRAINNLSNSDWTSYRLLNQNTFRLEHQFGLHNIQVLGGQSIEYFRQDHMFAYAEAFPSNEVRQLTAGVENLNVNGWANDNGLFSLFGRLSYNYQSRYLLESNLRYDGSSRLPEGSRFDLFPSFSAGWVISSEQFMENQNLISFLKLRASWGQLGNQEIGNYPYSQTLQAGQDYIIGGSLVGGAAVTSLANPDIKWEVTTTTNIGLDAFLLSNQLEVIFDYFEKTTDDMLLRLPIPLNQGNVQAPFQNVGQVQNTGFEVALNYNRSFSNGLRLTSGINISKVDNKITDLGELGDNELGGWISGNRIYVEGEPIGAYYGFVADGYFQSQEEIDNHAQQFGQLAPGDIKFKDLNGDGVIEADNDRQIIGTPFPDYTFGFNFRAGYRGFDATAFLQGVTGVDRFNWYNNELTSRSNFTTSIRDRWSEDNRNAQWPRFGNTANNNQTSSYWLRDASYLRLKHLEFGYNLPQSIIGELAINSMRVYLAGYNLLTFTGMEDFDPERTAGDERNFEYPGLRTYAMGVSITF